MAEPFAVTPPQLRSVAGDLGEVSSQIKVVMVSLRAQLAGEGAGIACALTPGDTTSSHAQREHVHTTVDPADNGVLDYWANYLGHVAGAFGRSDQGQG